MKTKIPTNFSVTDGHREYSVRKGWPLYMPDQFITEFKMYHEAKGTRWKNWDQAFKLWMYREWKSKSWKWERYETAAKEQERQNYKRTTQTHYTQTPGGYAQKETTPTPMPAATRAILERMRR